MPVNRSPNELLTAGQKFGRWTLLEDQQYTFNTEVLCQCECGTKRKTRVNNLRRGRSTSCGCYGREALLAASSRRRKHIINPGDKFGRLTITDSTHTSRVVCLCECGNTTVVESRSLYVGSTRSCGCLKLDLITGLGRKYRQQQGASLHPLYATWKRVAKGHAPVHEPWRTSAARFIADVEAEIGERPSGMWFRYMDKTLGFVPGNISWAPRLGYSTRDERLTSDQRSEIAALVRSGKKQYEVAKLFQVSGSTVSTVCRDPRYA